MMNDITDIIVVGANGRMGSIVCRKAVEEPCFRLAGVVESKGNLQGISRYDCPAGHSLVDIIGLAPGAVVIDFTAPEASLENAATASKKGVPLVIGTTGFTEEQKRQLACQAQKAPIFWSANMSIGVNAIMGILPRLAAELGKDYDMEIAEIHHRKKKDAPSGTALMLGEVLVGSRNWKLDDARCSCRDGITGERRNDEIGIQAIRGGDVVGIHTVYFLGPGERIEVTHHAHSRDNFAEGALRAAQWLATRQPGRLYGMRDMLDRVAE